MRRVIPIVVFFGLLYAVLARVARGAFPFSGDEYSYLVQAEIFARGLLHAPGPPHPELFRVDHVVIDQWVRSKYPPGTSAILALGVLVRAPWLVTPVEGVVTLGFVWKAVRPVLGERDAKTALILLGAAPLFAFQSATFYGQTAATMWLAGAFACVSGWSLDRRSWRLVLAGLAVGCALITRPLDALLFGAALVSFRSVRVVALTVAGAAPLLALHLAYQALQFGSPLADGYHAYEPTFRAIYGQGGAHPLALSYLWNPEQVWQHLDIIRAFLVEWTVPGTALLALLGWSSATPAPRAAPIRRFAVAWVCLIVASLFVTIGGFDDGARPRYLSTALVPLTWLAAPGWPIAADILTMKVGPRLARVTAGIALSLAPFQLAAFLVMHIQEIWFREGPEKLVAARGIRDGLIIVRATYPTRYARNGPFFDRRVLYLSPSPSTGVDAVAAAFPGRPVFTVREPRAGESWTIE
jgi:Dolichyl-phosphate-mannose-protein mannosyltransferase